jgi:hypothetical protein
MDDYLSKPIKSGLLKKLIAPTSALDILAGSILTGGS